MSLKTTLIEKCDELELESVDMSNWPEYKRKVKGLVYLDEFDGVLREDNEDENGLENRIKIPKCDEFIVDLAKAQQPQYQCIKCGLIQTMANEIHRMKCNRCFNKAFNKMRPTRWTKFKG
ncbi:hypothetical protein NH340_JMT07029 [Sarcoptes scabiei]|nr:hypothetical protein QR98_0004950 [Sarcoptes scabiei]UXI21086.1 hypothetical protein NH340_JMT07029 [Sarcoptes scabiei]